MRAHLIGWWMGAVCIGPSAVAQPESAQQLSADRPGFATSPAVLSRGIFQVESGVAFAVEADGRERRRTLAVGSPLARLGVGRGAEIRVGGDGIRVLLDGSRPGAGAARSDTVMGMKLAIAGEARFRPAVALLAELSVPTGQRLFTSGGYDPGLALAWSKALPLGFSAGGSLACRAVSDGVGRRPLESAALAMGFPLPRHFNGFVEVYETRGDGGPRTADAGISRTIGANLQVDLSMGRAIGTSPVGWFAAAGVAFRRGAP